MSNVFQFSMAAPKDTPSKVFKVERLMGLFSGKPSGVRYLVARWHVKEWEKRGWKHTRDGGIFLRWMYRPVTSFEGYLSDE